MIIREADIHDINRIVTIHCDAFQGFFLTSLGTDFLKLYYHSFMTSNETILLVAEDESGIIGFSAAAMKSRGFNKRLIQSNIIRFTIIVIKLVFTNPKALYRLSKNITKKGENSNDSGNYAELFSIGVSKNGQGRGIGKELLAVTESKLKAHHINNLSLTTDFYDNKQALSFYYSMGYTSLYEFIAYPNRKMYRLIKRLE